MLQGAKHTVCMYTVHVHNIIPLRCAYQSGTLFCLAYFVEIGWVWIIMGYVTTTFAIVENCCIAC